VPFEEEEEIDSIGIFYFDFDPSGWELPISFDLKIIPKDKNGTPLDEFEVPVLIEDHENISCIIESNSTIWEWIYTERNGQLVSAPMFPSTTSGTVSGCCDRDGNSFYDNCINTSSHRVVNYETIFMVSFEYLKFFSGGDVGGELSQFTQNVRPSESDFCSGTAGYSKSNTYNPFVGKYTYDTSNCTISITSLEGETEPIYASDGTKLGDFILPIYAGVGPSTEYKLVGNHFMRETRFMEGESFVRMYEARSPGYKWRD
jgi:hypothetical protein